MKTEHAELIAHLEELRAIFPGLATVGYLRRLGHTILDLEEGRRPHFGGVHVLAWWLVQRCRPHVPLTKARLHKLALLAGGSQRSMDLLVAAAENRYGPSRLQHGWDFGHLTSYMAQLWDARIE